MARTPLYARKLIAENEQLEERQRQADQEVEVAEPEDDWYIEGFQEALGDHGLVFCLLPKFAQLDKLRGTKHAKLKASFQKVKLLLGEAFRKHPLVSVVRCAARSQAGSFGKRYEACRTAVIYVPEPESGLTLACVGVYAELGSGYKRKEDRAIEMLFIGTGRNYKGCGLSALIVERIKAMAVERSHKYFFASVIEGSAHGEKFWNGRRMYRSLGYGDWGHGTWKDQPEEYVKLIRETEQYLHGTASNVWSAKDMVTDLDRCLARAARELNPDLDLPGSDDEDFEQNQEHDEGVEEEEEEEEGQEEGEEQQGEQSEDEEEEEHVAQPVAARRGRAVQSVAAAAAGRGRAAQPAAAAGRGRSAPPVAAAAAGRRRTAQRAPAAAAERGRAAQPAPAAAAGAGRGRSAPPAPAAAAGGVWGGIQAVGAAVLAGGQALVAAADGMIRALTPGKRRADRPARARSPDGPELSPRELAAEDFEDEIEPAPLGKVRRVTQQQLDALRARRAQNQGAVPAAQPAGTAAAGPSHGGQRQPPAAASGVDAGQVQAAGGTRRGGDRQVQPDVGGSRRQSRTRAQRAVLGRRNIPAPRRKRAPRQKAAPAAAAGPSARPAPAAMGRYIMDDNGVMHAVVSSDEEREDDDDDDVIRDDLEEAAEEEEEADSEATEDEPWVAHAVQQRGKRQRVGGAPAPRAGRRGAAAGGTGQAAAARGSPRLADGALHEQPPAARAGGLAQGVPQPSPRQRPVLLPGAPADGAPPRSPLGGMPAGKLPRGLLLPRTLARGAADGAPRTMANGPPLPLAPLAPLPPVGVALPQAAAGGGAPVPEGLVQRAPPQGPLAAGRAISQDVLNDLLDWCEGDPPATLEDNAECKQIFIRARAAGLTPWQFLRGLEAVAGHYNIGGCIYECLAGIMQGPQDGPEPDLDADVAAVPPAAANGARGNKRSRLAGPAATANGAGPSTRLQPLGAGGLPAANGLGGVPVAATQEQPDEATSDEDAAPPPRRAPRHKVGPAADNAAAAGGTGVGAAAAQPPGPSHLLGDATRPRGRSAPVPQQVAAPPGRALRGRQTDPPAPITSLQCNAVAVITSADDVAAIVEGAKGVSQRAAAGRKPMATRHTAAQPEAAMAVDPAAVAAQAVHAAAVDAADAPAAVPDPPPAPVPRQEQFLNRLRRAREAAPARPSSNTSKTTLQPLTAAPAPLAPAPAPTAGPNSAPAQQAPPGAPAPALAATPGPATTTTTTTQTNTVAPAPATTTAQPAPAPSETAGPIPAPPPHLPTTPAGNLTCAQPPSRTNPSRIASWFSGGRKRPLTPGPVEQGAQAKKPRQQQAGEQGAQA